ncbi:hypothetical protein KIPB_014093, partial [Kipferlia bialata]|eukprot:g14093.t1
MQERERGSEVLSAAPVLSLETRHEIRGSSQDPLHRGERGVRGREREGRVEAAPSALFDKREREGVFDRDQLAAALVVLRS